MPGMEMKPGETMQSMPGTEMPQGQTMPGMQMPEGQTMRNVPGGMEAPSGTDLPAGNVPPPPLPADHAADRVYGPQAMAMGRHHLETFHGGQKIGQVFFNLA
ncbi:MAG TPA: copper resistance protein B, partial [Allosphingosinicella sp.]